MGAIGAANPELDAAPGTRGRLQPQRNARSGSTARVFESEAATMAAIRAGEIVAGNVIVVRNVGPVGGPGMPEMVMLTIQLQGRGLGEDVALITDGRFSGVSHGIQHGLARALAGPRGHAAELHAELQRVAGADLTAESGAVDPAEQRQLAGELLRHHFSLEVHAVVGSDLLQVARCIRQVLGVATGVGRKGRVRVDERDLACAFSRLARDDGIDDVEAHGERLFRVRDDKVMRDAEIDLRVERDMASVGDGRSVRKHSVFATSPRLAPIDASCAFRFSTDCAVCAATPPATKAPSFVPS